MNIKIALPLFALVLGSLAVGCSSADASGDDAPDFDAPKAVALRAGSVKATQHFANTVSVEEAQLVVTMDAENERVISQVAVGTIIAGNRDLSTPDLADSKNPHGFLRRVMAISRNGGTVTISTQPAALEEWIEEGDVFAGQASIFEDGAQSSATSSIHVLDAKGGSASASTAGSGKFEGDEQEAGNHLKVRPYLTLTSGTFALNPSMAGTSLKVRKLLGVPTGIKKATVKLAIDPTVTGDIELGVRVGDSESEAPNLGGSEGSVEIASKTWPITPKDLVIPVDAGIPFTVRLRPKLHCDLGVYGTASVSARVNLHAHAAAGFSYDGSFHDLSEAPKVGQDFVKVLGYKGQLTGTATCRIVLDAKVLAFDSVGIDMQAGPQVSISANVCETYDIATGMYKTGFTLSEQHELYGSFAARMQIPLAGIGKNFQLLSWDALQSKPLYMVGDKNTCKVLEADSCDGKNDGFYCSELAPYSGYYCEGGSIVMGRQCDKDTQKCVGGDKTKITCK